MDVYQSALFKSSNIRFFASKRMTTGKYSFENDTIVLTQDEDITIDGYTLRISNNSIQSIFVVKEKQETLIEPSPEVDISIDFNNPIAAIRITFKNNFADDLTLTVVCHKASAEAYYAKQEQQRQNQLLVNASVKYSTGTDLVNIYFQPCSDDYARAEIVLYREKQMLAKYKVDEDCFFKAITGLAFGTYGFILKQFDKNNALVLETPYTAFKLVSTRHSSGEVIMPYGGAPSDWFFKK